MQSAWLNPWPTPGAQKLGRVLMTVCAGFYRAEDPCAHVPPGGPNTRLLTLLCPNSLLTLCKEGWALAHIPK